MSSEHQQQGGPNKDPGWLMRPENVKRFYIGLWVICIGLIVADLMYHKHPHFAFEGWFGFHGWFGFLAFAFVVLSGWGLRRLLSRPEDYYDE